MTRASPIDDIPHSSCRILRIGTGYGLAIFVSPADAGPETPGVQCHRIAAWELDGHRPFTLHPISPTAAMEAFCSLRDQSLGAEPLPKETFVSLADAVAYIVEKHLEAAIATIAGMADGFQSLRIEPDGENAFRVDIVCRCGRNGLREAAAKTGDFHHRIELGGPEKTLICGCGANFRLRPQRTHVHVELIKDGE